MSDRVKRSGSKPAFVCPDCGSHAPVQRSKKMTETVKEFTVICQNNECGGRYVYESQPVRILVPSLIPNPKNTLPLSQRAKPRIKEGGVSA